MNAHDRARDLIASGTGDDEQRLWLDRHLAECPACSRLTQTAVAVTASLRASSPMASSSLVHATHLLVRARALQLNEMHARMRMMWIGMGLGIVIGIITTPLLWMAAEWVGHTYSLSTLTWQAGFLTVWFLPASFAAAAAFALRPAVLKRADRR